MNSLSEKDIARPVSRIPRSFGIHAGIWSVTICLAVGLAMRINPFVILWRALICFVASGMLGYMFASLIGKCAKFERKPPPEQHEQQDEFDEEIQESAAQSQDDQEV